MGLRHSSTYYIDEVKCDGFVACGTTGESPTLDHAEHARVIKLVVDEVKGRVPVMAGTGSNRTKEAIAMTKHAADLGCDASLQVCPYYNRPTQDGLLRHFEAIAEARRCRFSFTTSLTGRDGLLKRRHDLPVQMDTASG